MAIDQRWLKFLREQYPVGSRIKLREMKDPFHPVEPGTMGTLDFIDDAGDFQIKCDDGRTLSLKIGEDSFTVLPPETHLLKLYMPMAVDCYERNRWGDYENEPTVLSCDEAVQYADNIAAALRRELHPEEAERGLMTYYDEDDGVDSKVKSCRITAEVRRGRLWGVAECQVIGALTATEMTALKQYISAQSSDGFGEGFEQREIKVGDCQLYAHLWQGEGWSIQTEQECFAPRLADGLPELCFSTLKSTGALICIKRGESGYFPSDWSTDSPERNQELADYNNERLGVTDAQRQAMECGSLAGWNTPGADPKAYEQDTLQIGGMTLG